MKRLLTEIGLTCLIMLAFYFLLFTPALNHYKDRSRMIEENAENLDKDLIAVTRSKMVEETMSKVSSELGERENKMKATMSAGETARYLRERAAVRDLKILTDAKWVANTKPSIDEESQWDGQYTVYSKQMTLIGEFTAVGDFLKEIEEMDSFARTTKAIFKKKGEDDSELQVDLTISLYDMHQLSLK
jgi:hypothetical protein